MLSDSCKYIDRTLNIVVRKNNIKGDMSAEQILKIDVSNIHERQKIAFL